MKLDWRRIKAVVLESDDWGLCGWVPDEQAHCALAGLPAFRGPFGASYGRTTLESAADVERLASTLLECRGADGIPAVWQANTIVANPDYARLTASSSEISEIEGLPLVGLPDLPSRWERPGMWDEVGRAIERGVWWPELHGLHHLPAAAWLRAIRRGETDAARALEHHSPVCEIALASSEYDPTEPAALRASNLTRAVERFAALFGRRARSWCPPSYRWDGSLEEHAGRLGILVLQGRYERAGMRLRRWRRWRYRFRKAAGGGKIFSMPPRIPFEPRGGSQADPRGVVAVAHRSIRAAWKRDFPAVIISHRGNYASLDEAWSRTSREAVGDLLRRVADDGAIFLTDAEAYDLLDRGWSVRALGRRGVVLRCYGVAAGPVTFEAPPGIVGAAVKGPEGAVGVEVVVQDGRATCEAPPGAYVIEWQEA